MKENRKIAMLIHPVWGIKQARFTKKQALKAPGLRRLRWLIWLLPAGLTHLLMPLIPVRFLRQGTIRYSNGSFDLEMVFWGIPFDPFRINAFRERAKQAAEQAFKLCAELGNKLVGLGALISTLSPGGKEFHRLGQKLNPSVGAVTGNVYTAVTTFEGVKLAVSRVDGELSDCTVAIIGATGSVGRGVSHLFCGKCKKLILLARDMAKLERLGEELLSLETRTVVQLTGDMRVACSWADVIIFATSETDVLDLNPSWFRSRAILVDTARPYNVDVDAFAGRTDLLIFDGSTVRLPEQFEMSCDIHLPPHQVPACVAETLLWGLEGKYESKGISRYSPEDMVMISEIAKKWGFEVAELRSRDHILTPDQYDRLRQLSH